MKKIILILICFCIFIIITNSTIIIDNIILSFNICFNNLFPSLIPFMFVSNLLIKYNFIKEISNSFKFIAKKIFRINENCSFAIIMSIFSGTPSNSKYLKDLYDNNLISTFDISKCLIFCHFVNPIFIIGTIGNTFLNNKKLGLIILISHYLSSLILGLISNKNNDYSINNINLNNNFKSQKFINILNESIINIANTLLLILGTITFSLIISTLLNNLLNINNNYKFIYGILEITQGLKYLSLSDINICLKTIISSFLISFGGICIHLQVFSILDNKKIRYLPYFISRLLHGILSSIITFLIIMILN